MQFPYGYPTPPASPSPFELPHCAVQPQQPQPVYVPTAPEARLGRFLAGTLQLQGILGTGAYGVVYSAVDVKTKVRYAVKTLSKFNADGTPLDRRQIAFQNREIRLHWLASAHPNVVSMLKIIDDPDCIYVILEYCPEGDLFYNITERGQYVGKDDLAKRVFLQILEAVEYCHAQGIYHRDLKPENILVTDNGETVKLADFGLATSSDRSEDYGCGSTFYMSPECLDHTTRRPYYFCAPNDVWSLGVILVNLTCGRNPWKQASFEDSTYRAYTRSKDFLKTILPVSDELNDILAAIFTRNPDERITLPELKARILACHRFTLQEQAMLSSSDYTSYVEEDAIVDDDEDFEYDDSPVASDDDISDDESMTSSVSSLEDLEEDDSEDDELCPRPRDAVTPPPQPESGAVIFDPECSAAPGHVGFPMEYVPQFRGHATVAPIPIPSPPQQPAMNMPYCGQHVTKAPVPMAPYHMHHHIPYVLDAMYKYQAHNTVQPPLAMHHHHHHHAHHHPVQPPPVMHQPHPVHFRQHHQMPIFACY